MESTEQSPFLYGTDAVKYSSSFSSDEVVEIFLSGRGGLKYGWGHVEFEGDHLLIPVKVYGLTGNPLTLFDIAFMLSMIPNTNNDWTMHTSNLSRFVTVGDLANVFHIEGGATSSFHHAFLKARSGQTATNAYWEFGKAVPVGELLAWTMVGAWGSDNFTKSSLKQKCVIPLLDIMTISQAWEALESGAKNAQNLLSSVKHANLDFVNGLSLRGITSSTFITCAYRAGIGVETTVEWYKAFSEPNLGRLPSDFLIAAFKSGLSSEVVIRWFKAGVKDAKKISDIAAHPELHDYFAAGIWDADVAIALLDSDIDISLATSVMS